MEFLQWLWVWNPSKWHSTGRLVQVAFVYIHCTAKLVAQKPPRNMQCQHCRNIKRKCVCVDAGFCTGVLCKLCVKAWCAWTWQKKTFTQTLKKPGRTPLQKSPYTNKRSIVFVCANCSNQMRLTTTIEHWARAMKRGTATCKLSSTIHAGSCPHLHDVVVVKRWCINPSRHPIRVQLELLVEALQKDEHQFWRSTVPPLSVRVCYGDGPALTVPTYCCACFEVAQVHSGVCILP